MNNISSLCKAFLVANKGTIAVATAIMLPSLFGFYSIAIDGSRFNGDRARLNDAINNGVYALAVVNNGNETAEDRTANVQLASNYISYYFPGETIDADEVTVKATTVVDEDNQPVAIDYQVSANKISHPIFEFSSAENKKVGFNKNVTVNGNNLSGAVRRTTVVPKTDASDYVFALDFSSSMRDPSAESGYTREKLLKKVVRTLGQQVFDLDNGSTIGIVPYAVGVPAALDKTNYASSTSKEVGCTFAGKMKGGYESLDWSFWYNKPTGAHIGKYATLSTFKYYTDIYLRGYYINTIAKANGFTGTAANNWLIERGYCQKASDNSLVCDADSKSALHNEANNAEINKNLQNFLDVSYYEYIKYSIMNEYTMDIDGTLSGDYLFDEKNVKTMVNFQNGLSYIPFYWSCAYAYDEKYMHSTTLMYQKIKEVQKPPYYLVKLTADSSVLDEFDAMYPQGYTDSLSGLLRSVPLLAQGKNPRKYIFVISDGLDSHPEFRRDLMKNHNLCGVIKDGLKKYPSDRKATESDIFYISLVNNGTAAQWANECVGASNAFVATSLQALIATLSNIIFKNTIEYINPADISGDDSSDDSSSDENYSDQD